MRFVERLEIKPTHCLGIPFLGANHPKGYVDFGVDLNGYDNHVALSIEAIQQVAALIPQANLVSRDELTLAQAKTADLEREVEDLRAQLAEADKFAEAAEWTLKHFGTRVQSKPGRKPAVKA